MDNLVMGDYILLGTTNLTWFTVVRNHTDCKKVSYYVPGIRAICSAQYCEVVCVEKRPYKPLQYRTDTHRVVVKNPVILASVQEDFYFFIEEGHPHMVESSLVKVTKKSYIVQEYVSGRFLELRRT